jgi:NAD(P)-dependent dehydrogenase (short-subunit alcohol dehydrogenase family)
MLLNKTILIAGAAGVLGMELVHTLISAKANVIALDVNEKAMRKLVSQYNDNSQFTFLIGDLSDVAFLDKAIAHALNCYGTVHGAVNTTYPRNKNYGRVFEEVTYQDFCANMSMHVGLYFLFMQQTVKYSINNNVDFSLVNLSSIYGSKAPHFDIYENTNMTMPVEYSAIKSAINHLTSYVAAYTKKTSFRVNCVSPGGIFANQDPHFIKNYSKFCKQKGMLNPSDIVPTILFLLSDASKHIVGQNLIVDDGFSI